MRAPRKSAMPTALFYASTTPTPAPSNTPIAASDIALQQILSAYAVLGDAARRTDYDRRPGPTSQRDTRPTNPGWTRALARSVRTVSRTSYGDRRRLRRHCTT